MKIFDTLKELWQYCLYCPLCRQPCRTISVSVGPDDMFRLDEFNIDNSKLNLICTYNQDHIKNRNMVFHIDFSSNACSFSSLNPLKYHAILKKYGFYFYLHGSCKLCKKSSINTLDIDIVRVGHKTYAVGIGIDTQSIEFNYREQTFVLEYYYQDDEVAIFPNPSEQNRHGIVLPIVEFDFTDSQKTFDRIKTFILYS